MVDKIYTPNTIVIETPFFITNRNMGAFFSSPPEGSDIIPPNKTFHGSDVLWISEQKAPSIFKEYYSALTFKPLVEQLFF